MIIHTDELNIHFQMLYIVDYCNLSLLSIIVYDYFILICDSFIHSLRLMAFNRV